MMKFSNRIQRLNSSPIRRLSGYVADAKARGLEVIPLNIGQPDIPTPREFYAAISDYDVSVLEYADSRGLTKTLETMQLYLHNYGLDFDLDEIVITNGASEGLLFTMMALLDDGDEVLSLEPFYPNYSTFIKMVGANMVNLPTSIDDGFRMPSLEAFEERITDRTRAILISSPSNPTGRVYTKEEIDTVVALAEKHDLFIIADEVYREFNYTDRDFHSFGDYEEIQDRVILLDSISKKYSACGARIGSITSKNADFIAHVMKLCQGRLSVSTLDQIGAGAMDLVDDEYVYENRRTYKKRRDVLDARLKAIEGVRASEPEGAFYTMVQLPVDDAEKFIIFMLENIEIDGYTVNSTPAESFYSAEETGKNEIRLSYCVDEDMIHRAMDILEAALKAYNQQ